jgi:hypothetical protein
MKRLWIAALFAVAFGAPPASAETCQECLDMLDVNEGVKCWKENDCGELTTDTGGGSEATLEERWLELRKKRVTPDPALPKIQAPTAPPTPTVPSAPSPPTRTPAARR